MCALQSIRSQKDILTEADFGIKVVPRTFHCPLCQSRTLHGYTFDSKPSAMVLDRYLFAWIQDPHYFNFKGERLKECYTGLFDLYICPRDLFVVESRLQIQSGRVHLPKGTQEFYEAHGGATPTATPTLRDMFFQVLVNQRYKFLQTNWLLVAKENLSLSYRGWLKYSNKPNEFRKLLARHILSSTKGKDNTDFIETSAELGDVLDNGIPGLFAAQSFKNRNALSFILQYKLYEMTFLLHEMAQIPFSPIRKDENALMLTLRSLIGLSDTEELDRTMTGMILLLALKLAIVTENHLTSRRALAIAFYASELAQKCKPWDYGNREINPNLLLTNNEAVIYINLLLRKQMRIPDNKCMKPMSGVLDNLAMTMKSEKIYSQYNTGDDSSRRGVVLGEHLKRMIVTELGAQI